MDQDPIPAFWSSVERLATSLSRYKAINVNSQPLRDLARTVSQEWFRTVRPLAARNGLTQNDLQEIDSQLQYLLRLSTGRNAKASYVTTVRALKRGRPEFEGMLEQKRSAAAAQPIQAQVGPMEARIADTLERMLPQGALCYRQVLLDIAGPKRLSYRGTATELREVVRELLDHLAPDKDVVQSDGFALEKGRLVPTMKQKARFILKARGLGDTSRKAPEQAVELMEDQIASIARSVYERGSASTHGATTLAEVQRFKGYADAVLAELLQVYK
jgi:hypothetical protein